MTPANSATLSIDHDPAAIPLGALQASLFRLMTLYSVMPCLGKARTIVRMLLALLQHPDLDDSPPQRAVYRDMLDTWTQLAQSTNAVRFVGGGGGDGVSFH